MAETCAYVLGEDAPSRKATEDAVSEIYATRSKVVHGGETSVSIEEYDGALSVVSRLITKLLTDPELSAMRTPEDLSAWVKIRKYA